MAEAKGLTRRRLLGLGLGAATGWWLPGAVRAEAAPRLRFVQLSDIHLGYRGEANRDIPNALARAMTAIARLQPPPALVVVTGDLTQAVDEDARRRERLALARQTLAAAGRAVYTLPGEHDALPDGGAVYRQVLGEPYYAFSAAGVRFLALDNVSHGFFLGRAQLAWLGRELERLDPGTPVVVLAHAPLHPVFPPWNWYTYDGAAALTLLRPFRHVLILSGHVHQVLRPGGREQTALPLAWPYPEPRALTRLFTWPQSQSDPWMGLGWRVVDVTAEGAFRVMDQALAGVATGEGRGA
ncbi:Metallophosphoesterase [Candidatus Hydrogenisulfobacillus filiaventi]|uniref:Metallophosphoesterase n=1 Tax=Candidatus Hydrogenisulfobacillus filiaventi TaxID=2707344 RepID=A0A6F8ZJR3_9FIRM|nr:Metallophosphoesterase [Candidatus Hydrogenisulfobacillus filiaventi]